MRVGVIGGGFGYGLAVAVARGGHEVTLCTRRSFESLRPGICVSTSLDEVLRNDLVYVAVPSPSLAALLDELVHLVDGRHRLVHVSRGLIGTELKTVCQVLVQRTSARRVGVLAGPLSDAVLREGGPGGAVVASDYPEVIRCVRETLGGPRLRIYGSTDRQGVEVGAAMTGILLFALGFGAGMGFGPSTLGMLAARGMAEIVRVTRTLGGRAETLTGLAGFGDLMSAVAGDRRPEYALGEAVAKGLSPGEAQQTVKAHVEGAKIIDDLCAYASSRRLELPLVVALGGVLRGELSGEQAVERLMSRAVGGEGL